MSRRSWVQSPVWSLFCTLTYMVKLGSGVVCWRSKLQQVVTRSTTEAEYIAAEAAGMEICWVQNSIEGTWIHPICTSKIVHGQSVDYVCGEKSRASWSYEALGSLLLLVARSGCDKDNPTFISQHGGHIRGLC